MVAKLKETAIAVTLNWSARKKKFMYMHLKTGIVTLSYLISKMNYNLGEILTTIRTYDLV